MARRSLLVIMIFIAGKLYAHPRNEISGSVSPLAEENETLDLKKELDDLKTFTDHMTLASIAGVILLIGSFTWVLLYLTRKSRFQKEALEVQAEALIRLNEELKYLNKTLEERIMERTAQLQLQNQRITEYTFINAHKLRAPVASILGLINLFDQAPDDERAVIAFHLKKCGLQLDCMIHELSANLEEAFVPEA